MKNYAYIFIVVLVGLWACADSNVEESVVEQGIPIEFSFGGSVSFSKDSKRYGVDGTTFRVGDTILIGQYSTLPDGSRNDTAAYDAQYYMVRSFDSTTGEATIGPINDALAVLDKNVGLDGKAYYVAVSGGNGASFDLSIFDNVDSLVTFDYANMNNNFDVLSQATTIATRDDKITFDNLEHLCSQVDVIIKNYDDYAIDYLTQQAYVSKSLTPVYSDSVAYGEGEPLFTESKRIKPMNVIGEGEGVHFRSYILPAPDSTSIWHSANSFYAEFNDGSHRVISAFYMQLKPGRRYTILTTISDTTIGGEPITRSNKYSEEQIQLAIDTIIEEELY